MRSDCGRNGPVLAGTLVTVLCLAYFYLLDRIFFSSAHFSPIFELLLTVHDPLSAWVAVALCAAAAAWDRAPPILSLIDFIARHPVGVPASTAAVIGLASIGVYHNYPLCMDEYAAVFQAKIFASGHLSAQLPISVLDWLILPGFNGAFLIASPETGTAIEAYWPGFALLLAPFELVGTPWLCNAMLAGLALYLIYRVTLEITGDRRSAAWAMLFAAASGAFVANAISYYSMQAHLTLNLLFAWLLMRPTRNRVFFAGTVGSVALVLHNPFPHVLFALPWLFFYAADKRQRSKLPVLLLGYMPLTLLLGFGWMRLRTTIMPTSHTAFMLSAFPHDVFEWPDPHMLNMRVAALAKMCVWGMPCLFVFAVMGLRQYRTNRHAVLLSLSAGLTFVGYVFVDLDQGHGWGYRYFHSAWGVVPVLAGSLMSDATELRQRLVTFAGALAVLSVLFLVPFQMSQIEEFISYRLAKIPEPKRPGNNIYFIDPTGGFYATDFIQIDPLLRDPDLLLASRGGRADAELVLKNWPHAVRVNTGFFGEQWYLGPTDYRRPTLSVTQPHFVFIAPQVILSP